MVKVFVVMGGCNYEGMFEDSVKVFSDKVSAENYGKSLVSPEMDYDFYEVMECDVE